MKDFIGIFLGCFIFCLLAILFLGDLLFTNIWAIIILASFMLAILVKLFINQYSRIDELERKIEQLLQDKQN
ncbi:hypothetical protein [Proteiniborus sp.]|uniref:hypothetical protein n=1 Tax=Proteiniborus sp. TaxID=2079015 RepID=UPI00331F197F